MGSVREGEKAEESERKERRKIKRRSASDEGQERVISNERIRAILLWLTGRVGLSDPSNH